jgi:ribulose-5-phosphate 4-epimerase/fuculose-1-phosphate aldolase
MKRSWTVSAWLCCLSMTLAFVPLVAQALEKPQMYSQSDESRQAAASESKAKQGPEGSLRNEALRMKLEQAHRILQMEGLAEDSTRGHITARSEDGLFYIKPWGMSFEKVSAADLQGVDIEGNLKDGKGRMHSEKILHLEIYRARPEVGCVIHVHPYYSFLLSSVYNGNLSIIGHQGTFFAGTLPFFVNPQLIQTKELALDVVKTLGDKRVVLMKNHGITVVGRTVEEAVVLAVNFERAAKDHLFANLFGKPNGLSPEDIKKLQDNNNRPDQFKMIWDYWLEKVKEKR